MSLAKCLLKVGDGLSEEERRIYDASVQARVDEGVPLEEAQRMAAEDRLMELGQDMASVQAATPDNSLLEQLVLAKQLMNRTQEGVDGNLQKVEPNEEELAEAPTMVRGRGAYSILGNAIARDYKKKGVSTLIGKKIHNSQDLATLAQIYRNPSYETLRYFITNDAGEVVYQTGVTSRLPAYSAAIIGEPEAFMDRIAEQAEVTGGTNLWMLHNHPSGNPQPSSADQAITARIGQGMLDRGLNLQSHVIINHKRYATLDGIGGHEIKNLDVDIDYDVNKPSVAHPVLGTPITDPATVMEIGKNLEVNDDHIVVIGRKGARGEVSLLAEVTESDLPLTKAAAMLRKLALASGSGELFLYGVPVHLASLGETAIRQGFATDVIIKNSDGTLTSLRNVGVQPEGDLRFGSTGKQLEVAEYKPSDVDYLLFQSAYHGTPHTFDRFSLEAMGTGEGAQAFGWGIYLAGKREVAEWYRNTLSDAEGNLFEVEIPDDSELLDWDKALSEQPEMMKKLNVKPSILPNRLTSEMSGQQVYDALARGKTNLGVEPTKQAASEYLSSLGIPGLRYLEGASRKQGEGSYNYVIWEEDRVTVQAVNDQLVQAEMLEQEGDATLPPRATFDPSSHMIRLGEASDLSSFLHESAHLFLEMERYYADKFGITEDQRTILDWLGVESFDQIEREHHEKFAESFEVYLREGKAPSLGLREAFASFGRWLTRIYQELTDTRLLRADLGVEIREVFDRMLASQAEIEAAMADPVYDTMFRSKEEAGMTEQEWEKYQRNKERRVNKAQATIDQKLIDEVRKRRSAEWDEEKRPMVEKIVEHLKKQPVYSLLNDLKNYPMDWQIVKDITGATKISDLKMPVGTMKNEGVDPAEYAELYGYKSVNQMINAIVAAKSIKQEADHIAQELMISKYGDILNDGSIEEEAHQAAHNDAQAALLIQELRAVNRKTTINRTYLKAEARDMIASMTFKEINPNKFYAAEIRAAQRLATATTPEDKEAALIQRLANHYLYREAVDAKQRMQRHRKYVRRVQSKEYSTKDIDRTTLGAMKVLANMFELRNQPKQVKAMTEVLQWYDTQVKNNVDATLLLPELVTALQQRDDGVLVDMKVLPSFDSLTSSTMQGLYDMLRHMRYVGGKTADNKKAERGERARKFAEDVKKHGGKDVKDKRGARVSGAEWKREFSKFVNGFPSLRNLLRKLDGFKDDGKAFELIYRQIEEAQNRKVSLNAELYERYREELGDLFRLGINHKESGRREYRLQSGVVVTFTAEQRLMMAVYWGTESSREAVREGYGMTDADVARVMQDLTKDHLNLINAIWKVNESLWPDLASAAIARHGVAPPKLDATPFIVNGVKMTGGHMRLFYDSQTLEMKDEQEKAGHTMEVVPSKAGSLHARIGSGGKPVLLDKNNIARQLNEVTHYIAFAEISEDIRSIVNNKDVKDAVETKHGIGFYEALVDTIEGITGNRAERETTKFIARLSRWARRAATAKHLMFSPRNTIQQLASIPIVLKQVGPVKAAGAFLRLANPETRKATVAFINERSTFMENRASMVNREASEFINRMQASDKYEHVWNEFAKYGFAPQTLVDSFFAYPTWLSSYEQSMENHGDEKRAISEADTAVAESVGSGSDLHLGGMFQQNRSELIKMLTVFGSWFNNYYQRVYKATEAGTKIDMNAAMEITLLPFTVAILSALLVMDEPEDDEPLPEWGAKRYAGFMAGMVPVLRDVASSFSGFTPTMPITSLLEIPYKASQLTQGEKTGLKRSIDAAKVGTSAVPIPGSGAIIRVLEFMESDMRGKEHGSPLAKTYQSIVEGKDRN